MNINLTRFSFNRLFLSNDRILKNEFSFTYYLKKKIQLSQLFKHLSICIYV